MIRRLGRSVVCLLCTLSLLWAVPVRASEGEESAAAEAVDISSIYIVSDSSGFYSLYSLFDGKQGSGWTTAENAWLTLEYAEGIGSLYLVFAEAYGAYTITNNDNGQSITVGEDLFVHEFVDLQAHFGAAPKSVTISFDNGAARLHELDVYTQGQVPDSVQRWEHPSESGVDLMLFATHGDDDQLFFAGLLPYYAVERDYRVLVVYLTDHQNMTNIRIHEMLNGLWAAGITSYPVFGEFHDFGDTTTVEACFEKFETLGWSRECLNGFVVEQLRRYKPLVVVSHDFNGEYGHTQHKVYSRMVADGVALSADPEQYPELTARYGTWDVPKMYVHLYEENQIVMDWDQPMENFGGMTPYEVSKNLGFAAHNSQKNGWSWFLSPAKASDIKRYSPCEYGLYRTTVGPDAAKDDLFENLTNYAEQERIAEENRIAEEARLAEEARRAEEARLAEEKRLAEEEAARLASEEARLAEEASLAAQQQTETESVPLSQSPKQGLPPHVVTMIVAGTCAILAGGTAICMAIRKKNKKFQKI